MPRDTWDDFGPRFRPPPGVTLYVPVVVAFLIQVPATIAVSIWQGVPALYGAVSVGLAAASALSTDGIATWPVGTVSTRARDLSGFEQGAKGVDGGAVRLVGSYAG